jgi:hypothetical protein
MVIPNVMALFVLGAMVYSRFDKKTDEIKVEGSLSQEK